MPRKIVTAIPMAVATLLLFVALLVPSGMAQSGRNAVERIQDHRGLKQAQEDFSIGQAEVQKLRTLVRNWHAARAQQDWDKLDEVEGHLRQFISDDLSDLKRKVEQAKRETDQAKAENRQARRELRADRENLKEAIASGSKQEAGKARREKRDDRRDKRDDRRDAADDRYDEELLRSLLVRKQVMAQRLMELGSADTDQVTRDQQALLLDQYVALSEREVQLAAAEIGEDRKELREDRRETREDRRQNN
ncbi:hypothetical protein GF377_05200 [candidate division GN15 bacterium]|nr:hypothetical protein [candidate division GN15 bacterium]